MWKLGEAQAQRIKTKRISEVKGEVKQYNTPLRNGLQRMLLSTEDLSRMARRSTASRWFTEAEKGKVTCADRFGLPLPVGQGLSHRKVTLLHFWVVSSSPMVGPYLEATMDTTKSHNIQVWTWWLKAVMHCVVCVAKASQGYSLILVNLGFGKGGTGEKQGASSSERGHPGHLKRCTWFGLIQMYSLCFQCMMRLFVNYL